MKKRRISFLAWHNYSQIIVLSEKNVVYGSLLIDCDSPNLLETKGINVEVKNVDSVQNMPKEIRNSKPWRKFRKSRFSSLSNEYYLVLTIVFVFLGPAVWPSVWFVRWTNSYSTRAYYTQQTWQCKGGSQGKTGLFVFSLLFSSTSVFFLLAFRLSSSSLLFLCGMAWKTSFTMRRISILSSQLWFCLLAWKICHST